MEAQREIGPDGRCAVVIRLYPSTITEVERYVVAAGAFGAVYTVETAVAAVVQDWARARRRPTLVPHE